MSYTYLLESGEESSVDTFSDIPLYVLSRLNLTAERFSSNGNETASYLSSQSGTMSPPLTEGRGEEMSMWLQGGFPAPIYPRSSRMPKESTDQQADSGLKWHELSMKFDQDSSLLRTHRCLWEEVLDESSVTLPDWGMHQNGEFWGRDTLELVMHGIDFGFWATPTSRDYKDTMGMGKTRKDGRSRVDQLPRQVYASLDGSKLFTPPTAGETWTEATSFVPDAQENTGTADALDLQWTMNSTIRSETESSGQGQETHGLLNVEFSEWLNGFPIGWTDLKPLEMHKWDLWQQQHGGF